MRTVIRESRLGVSIAAFPWFPASLRAQRRALLVVMHGYSCTYEQT